MGTNMHLWHQIFIFPQLILCCISIFLHIFNWEYLMESLSSCQLFLLLNWAAIDRFVSERERVIGWLCVPELLWGHRDTRWVCINQEHTGSFSKPDLRGRSWGVWEEGGQFQRCCKQLKARTQQTHETSSRHKESKAECWYLTNNT